MLLSVLYIVGITAEAVTAALSAGRQKMDVFGVVMVACMTALGGGVVRDVLLNNYPLTWVEHPIYLIIVMVAALVTISLSFLMHYFRVLFLVLDAVGLATFSVLGTRIALELGHGFVIATVSSVVTGVAGGILRDLMSDRMPLVFANELYASISVLVTVTYMGLLQVGVTEHWVVIAALVIGFGARCLAIYYDKGLPVFEYLGRDQPIDPRVRLSYHLLRRGWRSARRRSGYDAARYALLNRQTGRHHRKPKNGDIQWSLDVELDAKKRRKHAREPRDRVQVWPPKKARKKAPSGE